MNTENQIGAVPATSHERLRAGSSGHCTPPWRYVPLALVYLCQPLPAAATDMAQAKWQKYCEALPDTNCSTFIQFGDQNGGPVGRGAPLAQVFILEPTRVSPTKVFRVVVHFQNAPQSQNGIIQVTVDAQPFANVPFVRCFGSDCVGDKQISAADVATFEGAKSFEIQSGEIKVSSPIGKFVEERAGRGRTFAEVNAEVKEQQEHLQQELLKKAKEVNERLKEASKTKFLTDAPAARRQERFCAVLKRVMAAVPDDFKSIMGAPDEFNKSVPDEYKESVGQDYSSRISIPGSGKCKIDANTVSPSYTCTATFKGREVADKQMAALAQLVGKCLPDVKAERDNGLDGSPTITFDNRKSNVEVWITSDKTHNVDGDYYEVGLWVDRGLHGTKKHAKP